MHLVTRHRHLAEFRIAADSRSKKATVVDRPRPIESTNTTRDAAASPRQETVRWIYCAAGTVSFLLLGSIISGGIGLATHAVVVRLLALVF
jgi:hypothetical protein